MKSNILFLFAMVLLTVVSCKKDETTTDTPVVTPPITNPTKNCVITKVVENQISNGVSEHYRDYDYIYDASGRLTNEDETCYICSENEKNKYVFANDTVKTVNKITSKVKAIYILNAQGYPKYSEYYYISDTSRTYYTYNTSGYIVKDSTYRVSPYINTYEWVGGNMTKVITNNNGTVSTENRTYFNDKSGLFYPEPSPVKIGKGSKNLLSLQYQYNSDGYVSKWTIPLSATLAIEQNYTYTCK
jgi:hypothetical protein